MTHSVWHMTRFVCDITHSICHMSIWLVIPAFLCALFYVWRDTFGAWHNSFCMSPVDMTCCSRVLVCLILCVTWLILCEKWLILGVTWLILCVPWLILYVTCRYDFSFPGPCVPPSVCDVTHLVCDMTHSRCDVTHSLCDMLCCSQVFACVTWLIRCVTWLILGVTWLILCVTWLILCVTYRYDLLFPDPCVIRSICEMTHFLCDKSMWSLVPKSLCVWHDSFCTCLVRCVTWLILYVIWLILCLTW